MPKWRLQPTGRPWRPRLSRNTFRPLSHQTTAFRRVVCRLPARIFVLIAEIMATYARRFGSQPGLIDGHDTKRPAA